MDDPRTHTLEHRVRFDECDAAGVMRPSALLRLVQDLAWRHSEAAGFDRSWYATHGLTWLVRFVELTIERPVGYGDSIVLTTQVTGWRRVWARRRTDVRGDGTSIALAITDWVLTDARGRPARVPADIADRFTEHAANFTPGRVVADPPADAVASDWQVRIRDLDPLAHVNNATYLDIIDERLAQPTGALTGPPPPVRYDVEYLRSAQPGDRVTIRAWPEGAVTCVRMDGADGGGLLRARVRAPS